MERIGNCTALFLEFIQLLGTTDDVWTVSQKAIGLLAEELGIGSVVVHASIPVNKYTPQGEEGFRLLYDHQRRTQETWTPPEGVILRRKEYVTGENGKIHMEVYGRPGVTEWTEAEETDIQCMMEVLFSFSARSRLIGQMRFHGMLDMMTGLPNSDGFIAYGTQLAQKGELSQFAAFYWNMQNMKLINQKYGMRGGNEVICGIGQCVKKILEPDEIVARLGGDNFVALVRKEHIHFLVTLLENMELTIQADGQPVKVMVKGSCGVYPIEDNVKDMSKVMEQASVAFRTARDILRKDTVIYSDEIRRKLMAGKEVQFRFAPALKNREFQVYYQPKVDTHTMCLVGAEALVRWYRDGKIVPPNDFIPILERDESVCKLDFYVLDRVCEDIRNWLDQGMTPVRVSVNFSRRHLSNNYLVEEILGVISKYRVPRKYIEVEITETVNEKEYTRLKEIVHQLHKEGIHVSIDDFGSGASSLNMLRNLPVDVLKIDRSFIDRAVGADRDRIVLTNIIRLSKELGIRVLTEGVENYEQMALLQELSCYLVQGYLFDKPLTRECFHERMMQKMYELNKTGNM